MLVSGSDFYCGNSSGSLCQFALKSQVPSQYVHPSTKQCNYSVDTSQFATSSELNSLKTSVSNGKSLIASAITGKGVSTDAGASFQTMASNIASLYTVSGVTSESISISSVSNTAFTVSRGCAWLESTMYYSGYYLYPNIHANLDSTTHSKNTPWVGLNCSINMNNRSVSISTSYSTGYTAIIGTPSVSNITYRDSKFEFDIYFNHANGSMSIHVSITCTTTKNISFNYTGDS